MTIRDSIGRYCSYFEEQLKAIGQLENRLYSKILLVTILDTLGRARHPKIKENKKRFLSTITSCGSWPDEDRVSLYLLSLSMSSRPSTKLKEETDSSPDTWQHGRIYSLEIDPHANELERIAADEGERKLIDQCRHANLLYEYRNHLVHEFREPGGGMEFICESEAPYYHGVTDLSDDGKERWELVYPLRFFSKLASSSLKNLRNHLEVHNLDPYSFYEFGTLWKTNR